LREKPEFSGFNFIVPQEVMRATLSCQDQVLRLGGLKQLVKAEACTRSIAARSAFAATFSFMLS